MTQVQATIRRPTPEELPVIRALRRRVMRKDESTPPMLPPEAIDLSATTIHMAAYAGNEIVAAVRTAPIEQDPTVYVISRLFTRKPYRGQGIGSRLLKAVEQAGIEAGARAFVLDSRLKTEDFYARNGYWRTGRIIHHDNGDINHVMVKEVANRQRGDK